MGDWGPKTKIGAVGITILFAIYALYGVCSYLPRLGWYFKKHWWYIKEHKSLPSRYNWPKVIE